MTLKFDHFEYDRGCRELRHKGLMIPIEPQVFDLLGLLLKHRDRVVSKDEIVERVWSGRVVSDSAISSRVKAARQALGDDGRRQKFIRTVHGTGFRFIGKVEASDPEKSSIPQTDAIRTGLVQRDQYPKTSLIVLPFRSLDSDPASMILADAVHEDLTSQLARTPDFEVISRIAALQQPSVPEQPHGIGRDIGVGYVITGTVRPSDDMVRVTARVTDSESGLVITALTFDRKRSELLDLQNLLILEIVNSLGAEIDLAEVRKLEQDANRDPSAYFHFKQSKLLMDRLGWNKTTMSRVVGHLETARKADPNFAPAISLLALVKGLVTPWGLLDKTVEEIKPEVMALALEGVEKDPHRSTVLGWSGCALCDVGETELGKPHLERAIAIDPSNAQAYAALAWADTQLGDFDSGLQRIDKAIRISPKYPGHAVWLFLKSVAFTGKGNHEQAKRACEAAIRLDPQFAPPYIALADLATQAGEPNVAKTYELKASELNQY